MIGWKSVTQESDTEASQRGQNTSEWHSSEQVKIARLASYRLLV